MTQKRFVQVDAETGELIEEGFVAYVAPRRQNGFGKRWFAMAHDAAAVLKQVKNLEDFRVLMALLEQLDYENLITTNQAEIARELDMQRQNVQRSIKRLMALGVLLRGRRSALAAPTGSTRSSVGVERQEPHRHAGSGAQKRMAKAGIKGVIEGGQQAPQQAPERDPDTLDMFED